MKAIKNGKIVSRMMIIKEKKRREGGKLTEWEDEWVLRRKQTVQHDRIAVDLDYPPEAVRGLMTLIPFVFAYAVMRATFTCF